MKTITITAVMLTTLTALTGCGGTKGNGQVVNEKRSPQSFSRLTITGTFPVELTQDGGDEWVKVETDKNLQDHIVLTSDGDELLISSDDNFKVRKVTKLKVYVNVKQLKELNYRSVGGLTTKGALKLDSVEVNSEAVGKMKLNITADFLRANLNSVGSTELTGAVREVRINNKSVGALSAFGLKATNLMIHNTAVGTAEVYADSTFHIRSSAIGTLKYKGPGEVKELSHEGVGKVSKVE